MNSPVRTAAAYMLFCLTVSVIACVVGWLISLLWAPAGVIVAVALAAGGGWVLGGFMIAVKRVPGRQDERLSE